MRHIIETCEQCQNELKCLAICRGLGKIWSHSNWTRNTIHNSDAEPQKNRFFCVYFNNFNEAQKLLLDAFWCTRFFLSHCTFELQGILFCHEKHQNHKIRIHFRVWALAILIRNTDNYTLFSRLYHFLHADCVPEWLSTELKNSTILLRKKKKREKWKLDTVTLEMAKILADQQ